MKRIVILLSLGLGLVLAAGCNKGADKVKRISSIRVDCEIHTIVEDMATGSILSDETENMTVLEKIFKWEDDRLINVIYRQDGEETNHLTFLYDNGTLVRVDDKYGYTNYVTVENGLIMGGEDSGGIREEILYDENGRMVKFIQSCKDGESLFEGYDVNKVEELYEYDGDNIAVCTLLYYSPDGIFSKNIKKYWYDSSAPKNPLKGIFLYNIIQEGTEINSEKCVTGYENIVYRGDSIIKVYKVDHSDTYTVDEDQYPVTQKSSEENCVESDGKRISVTNNYTIYYDYL